MMANFMYNVAKAGIMDGTIDLGAGGSTLKIRMVMTNTTCDTEDEKLTMSGFTTIDVADGANYAEKTLANQVVAIDQVNNRGEFTADAVTYTALGVGTRQYQGIVIYKFVTNDADSIPIFWIDSGGFPFWGNGSNVTLTWNAEGIGQVT
jgi:hypothetical protein